MHLETSVPKLLPVGHNTPALTVAIPIMVRSIDRILILAIFITCRDEMTSLVRDHFSKLRRY